MHPSSKQAPPQCKVFLGQVGLPDVLQSKPKAQIQRCKADIAVTRAEGVPVSKGLQWQACPRNLFDCSCSRVCIKWAGGCATPTDEPEDSYKYALNDTDSWNEAQCPQDTYPHCKTIKRNQWSRNGRNFVLMRE